jgi:hypothetical protein
VGVNALPTNGFVQLGHDVEAIIGSAYPGFDFGGRNSAWHLFLTSSNYFQPAAVMGRRNTDAHLEKILPVAGHIKLTYVPFQLFQT